MIPYFRSCADMAKQVAAADAPKSAEDYRKMVWSDADRANEARRDRVDEARARAQAIHATARREFKLGEDGFIHTRMRVVPPTEGPRFAHYAVLFIPSGRHEMHDEFGMTNASPWDMRVTIERIVRPEPVEEGCANAEPIEDPLDPRLDPIDEGIVREPFRATRPLLHESPYTFMVRLTEAFEKWANQ